MPRFSAFARLLGRSDDRCARCQLPLSAGLIVRDIDANGDLADYHQACAPSLAGSVEARRLGIERALRHLS